jgi:peptidoglycan lytic transglycosylase
VQSNIAARMRGAGLGVLAPGALAFAATGGGTASADLHTAMAAKTPQPIQASFKRHNVLSGGVVPVKGQVLTRERGRKVLVQMASGHGWHTVARTHTLQGGVFRTAFRPHSLGHLKLRVRLVGPTVATAAQSLAQTSTKRQHGAVTVYRASAASWYGPGFYGGRTACGRTLNATTLGVANRTLPCGTHVTFHYGRHTVTATVIDRGPYASGREWDLTPATKARLGFPSTGTVWATA